MCSYGPPLFILETDVAGAFLAVFCLVLCHALIVGKRTRIAVLICSTELADSLPILASRL